MASKKLHEIGVRLAIRREGKFVNAYLAEMNTMETAKLVGSLAVRFAEKKDFFERWKAVMSDALALAVEDVFGQKPVMTTRRAPESERAGNA